MDEIDDWECESGPRMDVFDDWEIKMDVWGCGLFLVPAL